MVNLAKAEQRIEEGIASALTEVEAVEAGLRYAFWGKTCDALRKSEGRNIAN